MDKINYAALQYSNEIDGEPGHRFKIPIKEITIDQFVMSLKIKWDLVSDSFKFGRINLTHWNQVTQDVTFQNLVMHYVRGAGIV